MHEAAVSLTNAHGTWPEQMQEKHLRTFPPPPRASCGLSEQMPEHYCQAEFPGFSDACFMGFCPRLANLGEFGTGFSQFAQNWANVGGNRFKLSRQELGKIPTLMRPTRSEITPNNSRSCFSDYATHAWRPAQRGWILQVRVGHFVRGRPPRARHANFPALLSLRDLTKGGSIAN